MTRQSETEQVRGRILVVEDDVTVARTYSRMLRGLGFDVDICPTLADARARLHAGRGFVIALIDVGLPDGSGLELLEDIRTRFPATVPLVVTGQLDPEVSLECWTRGVLALNKPLVGAQLEALIMEVVVRHDHWVHRVKEFAHVHALSRQEAGVVRCAVEGLDLEQTAKALGCAPWTAGTYWRRVFQKTGLRSRIAVVAAVARRPVPGTTPPEEV